MVHFPPLVVRAHRDFLFPHAYWESGKRRATNGAFEQKESIDFPRVSFVEQRFQWLALQAWELLSTSFSWVKIGPAWVPVLFGTRTRELKED
jgi:hypothetical protein